MESIIVALITGVLSLVGVVITNTAAARRTENKITTAQAVTDTKLDELTREVREHNGFARRMPVVEEQIKVANHRISDLEKWMEGKLLWIFLYLGWAPSQPSPCCAISPVRV